MLKGIVVMLIGAVLCISNPLLATAQEEAAVDFASGSVTRFSAESLTINVFGGEENEEKVFVITDETTLENIGTIDELIIDDIVFVDFIEKDGKNVALNIFKSSENFDEGYLDELGEEPSEGLGYEQEEKE